MAESWEIVNLQTFFKALEKKVITKLEKEQAEKRSKSKVYNKAVIDKETIHGYLSLQKDLRNRAVQDHSVQNFHCTLDML